MSHDNKHNNEGTMFSETPCHKISKKASIAFQTFNLTAKERKTIFRMLSIVGVLYLTSTPLLSSFAYEIFRGHDDFFENYLYPWSTTMMFLSGVINPYIYCYRNDHFRIRKPVSKNPPVLSSIIREANGFRLAYHNDGHHKSQPHRKITSSKARFPPGEFIRAN